MTWLCREHRFDRFPLIMGIVNVTPDSFSDGGKFFDAARAIDHGLQLHRDGAHILDIGGESSRPGAEPVSEAEELRRVIPVIEALSRTVCVSVDTTKPGVAKEAMAAGASIVNDVAGFRDVAMIDASRGAGLVVNHMHQTPQTMQANPITADVMDIVETYFVDCITTLLAHGIEREAICLDPGIGFGKTFEQTLVQLRNLRVHQQHGLPVCVGVSRKGFLGQITGRPREDRLAATLALSCFTLPHSHVIRVHDVKEHTDAVKIWSAIGFTSPPF